MRLISQDGMIDVPYGISALSIGEMGKNSTIYIRSKILDEKPCVFATYSTKDKAIKVMEMLRKAYVGLPIIMQNVDVEDEFIEKLKGNNVVLTNIPNEKSNVDYIINGYFQFPKDDEVE